MVRWMDKVQQLALYLFLKRLGNSLRYRRLRYIHLYWTARTADASEETKSPNQKEGEQLSEKRLRNSLRYRSPRNSHTWWETSSDCRRCIGGRQVSESERASLSRQKCLGITSGAGDHGTAICSGRRDHDSRRCIEGEQSSETRNKKEGEPVSEADAVAQASVAGTLL
jgi:hypothetical protein